MFAKKNSVRGLLAVVGLGLAGSASAAYTCTGTIDMVSLNPAGLVTVQSSSSGLGTFYVCKVVPNTDSTLVNGVATDTCKAILATLLEAKATGAQVSWGFDDSLSCNRAGFNSGNWYYLDMSPSSWYYGPQIQ